MTAATSTFSVYDGRNRLGSVREAASGTCEAFDAEGRPLGAFPTRRAAVAAIPTASSRAAKHPERRP